jgi:hypothetical protein
VIVSSGSISIRIGRDRIYTGSSWMLGNNTYAGDN